MVGIFAMVDKGEKLRQYKEKLLEETVENNESKKEVILFFSFDIVNSSLYKTINYYGWAQTLVNIFRKLYDRVKEAIYEAELWRVLGDEAIFIVRIKSENDLYEYIDYIFNVLVDTIKDLKSGTFFDDFDSFSDREKKLMKIQNILSLKATAWLAVVSKFGGDAGNLFEEYNLEKKNRFYEFLGNDIDAGFRISKFTAEGRLAISFELAAVLSFKTKYLKKLNIITYKHLKGIWGGRLYPIIWYHNVDKCNNMSLEDTFAYDEAEVVGLIKEYYLNHNGKMPVDGIKDSNMFTDVQKAIDKITKDRNLQRKIKEILEVIETTDNRQIDYLKAPTLELHCVAVCYNQENGKILIAKRNDQKETEPGKWEFGCAKATRETNIEESVSNDYKEDFGINIKIIKDEEREDSEPIPLAMYQLTKNNGIHKGIIFLATINIREEDFKFTPNRKHSDIRWISEEEIDTFSEEAVKDFKLTLKSAFKKIKELELQFDISEK